MKVSELLEKLKEVVPVYVSDSDGDLFHAMSDSKEFEKHAETEVDSFEPYMLTKSIDSFGIKLVVKTTNATDDTTPTPSEPSGE